MSDDPYRDGFGEENSTDLTPEQVADEAKAEEEFISSPEDTVLNPLVPEEPNDEDESRLEGAIGSGDLSTDFPEETSEEAPADLVSNESNVDIAPSVENSADTAAAEPATQVESAPVESAPVESAPVDSIPVVPETTPAVDPLAASAAAAPVAGEQKKKSKKGLIIGLIVFLLLAGGGVGFFVWMNIHNSPSVMLKDAIAGLSKQDKMDFTISNLKLDAPIKVSGSSSGSLTADSISFKADGSHYGISGDVSLGGKSSSKIKYNAVYEKGGTAYLKVDGLSDSGLTSIAPYPYNTMISAAIDEIDGNWIKMVFSETSFLGMPFDCFSKTIDSTFDTEKKDEIAKIYKEHAFLFVDEKAGVTEKDGVKYFSVNGDREKLNDFAKALQESSIYKDTVSTCASGMALKKSSSDNTLASANVTGSSVASSDDSDDSAIDTSNALLKVGVKNWSHELVSIELDMGTMGKFEAKFGKNVSFETPDADNAKDINDVIEKVLGSMYGGGSYNGGGTSGNGGSSNNGGGSNNGGSSSNGGNSSGVSEAELRRVAEEQCKTSASSFGMTQDECVNMLIGLYNQYDSTGSIDYNDILPYLQH